MTVTSSGTAVVTLPTDTQILITREFDAPSRLVYKAWTTPELIKRWWSGDRGEMTIAEVDLRVRTSRAHNAATYGGERGIDRVRRRRFLGSEVDRRGAADYPSP